MTSTEEHDSKESNDTHPIDETELLQLLHEGNGECILKKPSGDADYDRLIQLSEEHHASVTPMQDTDCLLIREFRTGRYIDLRVAFAGNVDSGKSSLVGVLIGGKLDDGRGDARTRVMQHAHEKATGRTSAVAQHIIGFDSSGNIANYGDNYHGGLVDSDIESQKTRDNNETTKKSTKPLVQTHTWKETVEKSSKIISMDDLPGHEGYLKTTVFGLVGHQPHFACIVVGSNMGVLRMTKEHISLALVLKIPMFFVVTKIDICPPNILKETLQTINKILKLPGVRKLPYMVKNRKDVLKCISNMQSGRICPIILTSSVTGENIDLVRMFFNLLPVKRDNEELKDKPVEFIIDATYFVSGIGTVVSGILHQGRVKVGDTLRLGPDGHGAFRDCAIKGIHIKRVPVENAVAGQQVTFALKKERRSNIRKGQVLVAKDLARACWEFEADVHILYHSTTIKVNYQPVIHIMTTRQAAKIVSMDADELRTRDKARVRFRFMFRPVYLKPGELLIIREGRCKGCGRIVSTTPMET